MKILYTLGNFVYSGHQVLIYTINAKNESEEEYQQFADKCFAASFQPMRDMFIDIDGIDADESASPPTVSDVVWTHTSGNQYIGAGIWQKEVGGPIDFDALRLIIASARKKAEELDQLQISMPLLTRDHDLDLWNFIYPIIEEEFKGVDVQVIVHIPTEAELLAVIDNMGGEFNQLQMEQPTIRFT